MKKLLTLHKQQFNAEKFKVEFLEDAIKFLEQLDEKTRIKIIYNITKVQRTNNNELLKKVDGEIWEFRTLFNRTHYRLFAFWDKTDKTSTLVVSTHGIIKKTGKTPLKELEKANRLRETYFKGK